MTRKTWRLMTVAVMLTAALQPAAAQQRSQQKSRSVAAQQRSRGVPAPRALPRPVPQRPGAAPVRPLGRRAGPYQEPAFARGYADGYATGAGDSRDRDRYDPVGHRDYRSADQGYQRDYGSRDAYRNNYRAGFRQGYDEGYRENERGRR
jgi:hypothetical protein